MANEISPETIGAAAGGNLQAFEQIVLSFERAIYGHLYRIVSHRQTAEDLTQETFLKAYRGISGVNPEGNFRAWLYTVATNVANDYLRKKYRRQEVYILDDPEDPLETTTEETPYLEVERESLRAEVSEALAKIKPSYRTVLLLFYREELSYEEIAGALAVPVGTVKTHLHRAKAALRGVLKDPG